MNEKADDKVGVLGLDHCLPDNEDLITRGKLGETTSGELGEWTNTMECSRSAVSKLLASLGHT